MATVAGILASIAAIVTAAWGVFKYTTWKAQVTPDQQNQAIDQKTKTESQQAADSGRPV